MQARKHILSAATLTLAAALASATAAPAQAREGTYDGTYSAFGTAKATQIGKERLLTVFDENGLFISGNPMFDHSTSHCWGLGDFTKGVGTAHGYCVGTDPAGDQFVVDWVSEKSSLDQKTTKGTFAFTTGTGKYAGITGGGTYLTDGNTFRAPEKGTYFSHSTVHASYKLP